MPLILVLPFLLFIAILKIDPLKENIEKFRKHYNGWEYCAKMQRETGS